ncbi:MAG: ABC-2 family transporter protein [Planctomycetota bacterium]
MTRYLKMLWYFLKVSVQDDATYRVDFAAHVVMLFFQLAAELVALYAIFSVTTSLAGWSTYEILALLGVYRIMIGLITLFIAPNMRALMQSIRDGTFDFLLLMPIDAQFFASFRRIVMWRMVDIVLGIGIATFSVWKLQAHVSALSILQFAVLLSSGAVIIYSFWLVLATSAFWFTKLSNIEMVFWNVFEAGRYPVDIYRPRVRWGLTYVIPLAFLTTFPAGSLVGKTGPMNVGGAIVAAILSLVVSTMFWRFGLRRYSGASA